MNFVGGFGLALVQLALSILNIYSWIIIIRALLSWFGPNPYNPLVRILIQLTEPVLRPIRRLLPPRKLGGLDVSPLVVILLIQLVRYTLIYSLFGPRILR